MPNRNYINGRAFEYKRMAHYRSLGDICLRTAGSHGFADLIVIHKGTVNFVQCKRVQTVAQAERLIKGFKANPPMSVGAESHYIQIIDVYVKDTREVLRGWV
jgi:hypothetical protein